VDKSLTGILIFSSRRIHLVNKTFTAITGYDEADVQAMSPWDMVHPDERARVRSMAFKRFKKLDVQDYYETRWIHKDGHEIWVEVRAVLLEAKTPTKIMANVVDITKRKIAVDALKKREEDLQVQSRSLEETNIALRVLIKQRNEAVEELKNTIQMNVKNLVMPYVDELDGFHMKPRFKAYLETIRRNLEEIVVPIAGGALLDLKNLTPKQLKVLNLIHCGRSSKEIAELMGVSKAAVDFHRNVIRKKLNLSRQVNLRTFLDLNDPSAVVQNT
jgi:PAS domain S-box-containing protein